MPDDLAEIQSSYFALVPCLMAGFPVVVEPGDELHSQIVGVRVVGQDFLATAGLVPYGFSALQRQRPRISEPPDALEGAVVVVEGAVFLHEHNDVLDIVDRS